MTAFVLVGSDTADSSLQVLKPWCWYCEREFEDEKGESVRRFSLTL